MAVARSPHVRTPVVLALGFRPFFLAAGIAAVLVMALWLLILYGGLSAPASLPGVAWHAHELLFGYFVAVLAGFLLTAVRNWTGLPTPTGWPLGALVLLWLAGRLAPWAGLPPPLAAGLDLAFLPALALALRRPLWSDTNRVNRVFLLLLAGMTLAGVLVHLEGLGLLAGGARLGHRLMLDLALATILLVAGRVMPFFVERGIEGAHPRVYPWLERLTFTVTAALVVADLGAPMGPVAGVLAITLGLLSLARAIGWHHPRVWTTPMLTVLYSGLGWLSLGLVLDGWSAFSALPPRWTQHTLTVGALGVITLGMMARVTVGHTGRAMQAAPLTLAAFALINAAAALRGLGPLLAPAGYQAWLVLGALCWIGAFALYLWVHAPMLVRPRPDGRPG